MDQTPGRRKDGTGPQPPNEIPARTTRLVVAGALASALAGACAASPPAVERHARDEVVPLQSLRGKVVVINYWATWCQPCMEEIPALIRVAAENEGKVVLLAVNENDGLLGRLKMDRWLKKNPATFTPYIVYANRGLKQRYPWRVYPTTYVLDANGDVVSKVEGKLTIERARALVQAALERRRR